MLSRQLAMFGCDLRPFSAKNWRIAAWFFSTYKCLPFIEADRTEGYQPVLRLRICGW